MNDGPALPLGDENDRHGYSRGELTSSNDWNGLSEHENAIVELCEAIRLTVEYVGTSMLPPIEGWSWFDALKKYAPEDAEKFKRGYSKVNSEKSTYDSVTELYNNGIRNMQAYLTTPKQEIWVLYEMRFRDFVRIAKFTTQEEAMAGAREAITKLIYSEVAGTGVVVPNITTWVTESDESIGRHFEDGPVIFFEAYARSRRLTVKIQKELL